MQKIYSLGYYCYLCNEKNELIKKKNELYREAQSWKGAKHLGRADVCFEEYDMLKHIIMPKSDQIKMVGKQLRAKPVYHATDYSIIAIEMRTPTGYQTVADTPAKIKDLAEQYIIEAIVLGHFDDDMAISESK